MKGLRRPNAVVLDVVLAVGAATLGVIDALAIDGRQGPAWLNVAAMAGLGALVGLRRRNPLTATYGFVAFLLAMAAFLTPPPELVSVFVGVLVFGFAAGSRLRGAASVAYVPAVLAAISVANLSQEETVAGDWIFPTVLAVASYLAGRSVVQRAALTVELHEAALRAEEAQADEARRAVADERRRIAREMHDAVANSISVMVVQAGGARRILERDAGRAEQAAAQIERTGRQTLLEMRRLLGVMREPDQPADLEPNPTLADLDRLIARARAGGLQIKMVRTGEPRPVATGLELGAYRVVQDALEDVQRTVPGAEVLVRVSWSAVALELCISDDRPHAGPELVGVRERVALYGGEMRTGPGPDARGHELHVRLPVHDPDTADAMAAEPAQGAA